MNEEKMKVLNMIAEGKISAEEGGRLLEALDKKEDKLSGKTGNAIKNMEKGNISYMYVDVIPKNDEKGEKVHVKIPLALIRAGVNIATMLPVEVRDKVNNAMDEKGMKFDLSSLKPENIEELIQSLEEMEVNVDSDEYQIKVFCA